MRTRYVINDVCFALGIPWIYTAATASVGTIINFIPGKTPCFRCIFGEADEDNASCDRNGVILPILTFITSLQVTEGLKILLNLNPSTTETRYNIWTRTETSVDVSGFFDEDCSCQKPKDIKRKNSLFMICSGDSIQVNTSMDLKEIKNQLANWGFIRTNDEQQTKHDDVLIEMFACDKESISMVKNKKQWRERRIPRAVGYKTGKIVFYHIEKSQIEKWLH
jgi:adenylyltransferase/sulfurtransferase